MNLLQTPRIIANFNRASQAYDQFAFFQHEIADRLLDRLEIVKLEPRLIIDAGARTGYTSRLLQIRYPQAQIISVDWAKQLLKKNLQSPSDLAAVCASPESLPFASKSVDLIVANLTWHWLNHPKQVLQEWRRLLKPGGLLLFSTLGPDTFSELRASFAAVDDLPHVHLFLDMHDIGDALMAAQFDGPVMQAEKITLNYSSIEALWRDLRKTGVTNSLLNRRRTLTGKKRWLSMITEYGKWANPEEGWPVSLEAIYGLGWAAENMHLAQNEFGEVAIPIDQIGRKSYG
jgi:malonyl-CoA O-methyltransferase